MLFNTVSSSKVWYDKFLSSSVGSYGNAIKTSVSRGYTVKKILLVVSINTLTTDSILHLSKNGNPVYDIIIHTTDHGVIDVEPNISYEIGDDHGFILDADAQLGQDQVNITQLIEFDD